MRGPARLGLSKVVAETPRAGIIIPTRDEAKSWGWNVPETPGHGEIVGGEMSRKADEIIKLARSKLPNLADEVQSKLALLESTARYEGECRADKQHMHEVKAIHEATTDKIVCAALAVFEADMRSNGGLPSAVTISGYTLARMIDALNRVGYSGKGKK